MKAGTRPFTSAQICDALDLHGKDREQAVKAIRDFLRRGEIEQAPDKHNRRQNFYRYNHSWKRKIKGNLQGKVYKAMYVSQNFAVTDIQRLAEVPDRNYIDKLMRKLKKAGYIGAIGRRLCAHGAGAEAIYYIKDRTRFRLELMR